MLFWVTGEASKNNKLKNIYFDLYFYPAYASPYTDEVSEIIYKASCSNSNYFTSL